MKRVILPKRLVIIAALACFLLIFSCSKKREPGRYYSDESGFSIIFPEEWEIKEGDGESTPIVEAVSPWEADSDRFSEYVSVDIEDFPVKMTLEEYFAEVRLANSENYPQYKEHDKGETEINNQEAMWTRFDVGSPEGVMSALGFVMIKGKRGYSISCVAEDAKYDSFEETFEDIVHSFRIE